jgi:hypothetical protein
MTRFPLPTTNLGFATEVLQATLPDYKKNEYEFVQRDQCYPGFEMFHDTNAESSVSGDFVETSYKLVRRGQTQSIGAYDVLTANKISTTVKSVTPFYMQYTPAVFNNLEQMINRGDSEIFDHIKAERDAANEERISTIESNLWALPANPATVSENGHILGVLGWYRMANAGVVSPEGDFIGRTRVFADTTTDTNFGSLNVSNLPDLWNFAATHSGYNRDLIQSIFQARNKINFRGAGSMKQVTKPSWVIAGDLDFEAMVATMVNDGPDNRNGDIFPYTEGMVGGLKVVGVPAWQRLKQFSPVVVVNSNKFKARHKSGMFGKRYQETPTGQPWINREYTVDWYQYELTNPRQCGGIWHLPR